VPAGHWRIGADQPTGAVTGGARVHGPDARRASVAEYCTVTATPPHAPGLPRRRGGGPRSAARTKIGDQRRSAVNRAAVPSNWCLDLVAVLNKARRTTGLKQSNGRDDQTVCIWRNLDPASWDPPTNPTGAPACTNTPPGGGVTAPWLLDARGNLSLPPLCLAYTQCLSVQVNPHQA
jgi:hypothetical protein